MKREASISMIGFGSALLLSAVSFATIVQAEPKGCSNASLKGSFGFYRTGSTSTGPLAALGILQFDGKGSVSGSQSISRNGVFQFDSVISPAPYIVNEDCTGKLVAPDGTTRWIGAADCGFAYRDSRFKNDLRGHVVMRGRFTVSRDEIAAVRARTDAVQAERKRTQPYGVRSLGSTFKNPPDDFAGRLIEAAGLKGRSHGGAQISPKHANFILNIEHATASDVLALVDLARDEVNSRFGVVLEREIVVLGEPQLAQSAVRGAS